MLEFKKDSIYDAVGTVMASSKKCRQSIQPRGIRQHILCRIYDKHTNMIAEYTTTTQKGVFKSITRDMHKIGEGYVECICNPHPIFR